MLIEPFNRSAYLEKHFGEYWNKMVDGSPVSDRNYIDFRIEDDPRIPQPHEVYVSLTELWNPFPDAYPKQWGQYVIRRAMESAPAHHFPLGVDFAVEMEGKPWPEEWRLAGVPLVACLGSTLTATRAVPPSYPRLKCDPRSGLAVLHWKSFDKLQKSERVALYPTDA